MPAAPPPPAPPPLAQLLLHLPGAGEDEERAAALGIARGSGSHAAQQRHHRGGGQGAPCHPPAATPRCGHSAAARCKDRVGLSPRAARLHLPRVTGLQGAARRPARVLAGCGVWVGVRVWRVASVSPTGGLRRAQSCRRRASVPAGRAHVPCAAQGGCFAAPAAAAGGCAPPFAMWPIVFDRLQPCLQAISSPPPARRRLPPAPPTATAAAPPPSSALSWSKDTVADPRAAAWGWDSCGAHPVM